jgi:hypothetical protein
VPYWQKRWASGQRNFDSWQDNDTFRFTVEGERKGETFTFTYNIKIATLTCGWPDFPDDNVTPAKAEIRAGRISLSGVERSKFNPSLNSG